MVKLLEARAGSIELSTIQIAIFRYHISSYSFHGNYSFLNLEIVENSNSCRKFQFFTSETIQGRKLFNNQGWKLYEEIRYQILVEIRPNFCM